MTPRERTLACLRYQPIDRLPVVHFGFWGETLQKWAGEGHISKELAKAYVDGNEAETEITDLLGFDHCWTPAVDGNNYLMPTFTFEPNRIENRI